MGGKQHKKHKTAKPPKSTPNPVQTGVSTEPTQEPHRTIPASNAVERIAAWQHKPLRDSAVTIATLIMTSVIAAIYFFQLLAMRQTVTNIQDNFNAANRPFIGVNGITVLYGQPDESGNARFSKQKTPTSNNLLIRAEVKNFGPVSGTNYRGTWRMWLNGKEMPGQDRKHEGPITMFPGKVLTREAFSGTTEYKAIVDGEKILTVEIIIEYDGPGGHYTYCENFEYNVAIDGFLNLGGQCAK